MLELNRGNTMKYPIAIEPGNDKLAWGVIVPDLPGCFSAADSGIDEAIEKAKEAIELWIESALDAGQDIPKPSSITNLQKKKEFKGYIWAIAEIDPALLSDEIERVNISLPKRVLARLDAKAKSAGENRSAFIAHMAISA
jgi:predicted RNase H-like HicB family nuclease